jgi:hypothetical protein
MRINAVSVFFSMKSVKAGVTKKMLTTSSTITAASDANIIPIKKLDFIVIVVSQAAVVRRKHQIVFNFKRPA